MAYFGFDDKFEGRRASTTADGASAAESAGARRRPDCELRQPAAPPCCPPRLRLPTAAAPASMPPSTDASSRLSQLDNFRFPLHCTHKTSKTLAPNAHSVHSGPHRARTPRSHTRSSVLMHERHPASRARTPRRAPLTPTRRSCPSRSRSTRSCTCRRRTLPSRSGGLLLGHIAARQRVGDRDADGLVVAAAEGVRLGDAHLRAVFVGSNATVGFERAAAAAFQSAWMSSASASVLSQELLEDESSQSARPPSQLVSHSSPRR